MLDFRSIKNHSNRPAWGMAKKTQVSLVCFCLYEDRQHRLAAIWDPAGGFSGIRVRILTCLLGPDVIPWLLARRADVAYCPPFDPHMHLTHVGTMTALNGELDIYTQHTLDRPTADGNGPSPMAPRPRAPAPPSGHRRLSGLMRSVADHYARSTRGRIMRAGLDETHTCPTTVRLARLGNSAGRPIADSAQLTLPRTPTFEVSFDLP